MEVSSKPKVTAKVNYANGTRLPRSRPGSPTKQTPTSSVSPSLLRAKATVNSSAVSIRKLSSASSLKSGGRPTANGSTTLQPRAPSPFKPSAHVPTASTSAGPIKARVTARPLSSKSNAAHLTVPRLEERSRSAVVHTSDTASTADEMTRSSSAPLHHALSTSALRAQSPPYIHASPSSDRSSLIDTDHSAPPSPAPLKIKAKISGLAKSQNADSPSSLSVSPPWATTRPIHPRTRAPSISATFQLNPSPPTSALVNANAAFYPITTAAPAANPHRYAPPRPVPSNNHQFQPFAADNTISINQTLHLAKVDPASIPLPPHSPPISALSLSSRSSVSRSSLSLNTDNSEESRASISTVGSHVVNKHGEPDSKARRLSGLRLSLDDQDLIDAVTSREEFAVHHQRHRSYDKINEMDLDGSERKARAEAKSNRKIADLEITNRSLLAINASLETTKHRQAKELRELRRKLRESRLILPPKTYRAVRSSLTPDEIADDEEDEEEEEEEEEEVQAADDEVYSRIMTTLGGLIDSARRALDARPEDDHEGGKGGTKVLNSDELRTWRDSGQGSIHEPSIVVDQEIDNTDEQESETQGIASPSFVPVPDSDNEYSSEDEVEAIVMEPDSPDFAHMPPSNTS